MRRYGHHIAGTNRPTGLATGLSVDADAAALDPLDRKGAGLEQAGVKQPLVQPNRALTQIGLAAQDRARNRSTRAIANQLLSFSEARIAKGLSGSAFFSGRA